MHFIGIGGTGLSAIARVLCLQGYHVSGSDLNTNAETDKLQNLGATIYQGHHGEYVQGADWIIRSSAIKDNHVEVMAAQTQNIPVYKRSDVMAAILENYQTIAVAGTHGKTTTTSMITHTLIETGQQPSYIVGGAMANTGENADLGQGQSFVIEADEYDNMFHGLRPNIAVITSLEYDHPDFFPTHDTLLESFKTFVDLLPDDGLLIACVDNADVLSLVHDRRKQSLPIITYCIDTSADWRATNIRYQDDKTYYDVLIDEELVGTVALDVPGYHNILNSMVALIIAHNQGVQFTDAAAALATFKGTGRRFDIRAEIDDIIIVDDYAHHPTAIKTTLDAARQRYPEHVLWAIWQPHTYSRTQTLWEDYLQSFKAAHHVIITGIYPSREKASDFPDVQIDNFLAQLVHEHKFHTATFDDAVAILKDKVIAPAVILIMSAGDAPQIGIDYQHYIEGIAQ